MKYEKATLYTAINPDCQYKTAQEFFQDIIEEYPKLKTSKLVRLGSINNNTQYICELKVPEDVVDDMYSYQEKIYEGDIEEIREIEEYDHDENLFPGFFNEREIVIFELGIRKEWQTATIIP